MNNNEDQNSKELTKEIHHHHYHLKSGFNFGRLLLAMLVIVFGLFLMGKNLGVIPQFIDINWAVIWPVFIVIAGLSIMSGRGWINIILGIFALVFVGFVVMMMLTTSQMGPSFMGSPAGMMYVGGSFSPNEIARPVDYSIRMDDNIKKAFLNIKTSAGEVAVNGGSDSLVEGTFESSVSDIFTYSITEGEMQTASLTTKGKGMMMGARYINSLDAYITHKVPVDLSIDGGASKMQLDLTRVVLDRLAIKTGASSLGISLGNKTKQSDIEISAGASSIEIEVPYGSGVKIDLSSALTSVEMPGFKQIRNNEYQTDNYDKAGSKINIKLNVGLSGVVIKRK